VDKHISKTQSIRKFNKFSISQFAIILGYENCDNIFIENGVNTTFNNFLTTYLKIFKSSFPLQKMYSKHNKKSWFTTGIKPHANIKEAFI
jgi:hypothetical protein